MARTNWAFLLACLITAAMTGRSNPAEAALRQMIVIVEKPLYSPESIPTSNQLTKANDIRSSLLRRFLTINIEGHKLIDGNAAVAANEPKKIDSADCISQIIITVGQLGYRVKARLFDAASKTWLEIPELFFGEQTTAELEFAVANEFIPPIILTALELAQPSNRVVMFADCLAPAMANDDASTQAGRILSPVYAAKLKASTELPAAFSVVSLISTASPSYYAWWCTQLALPRKGFQRDDTLTISGSVENLKTTPPQVMISVEIKKSDRSVPSLNAVLVDLADRNGTADKINKAIQELAKNGL